MSPCKRRFISRCALMALSASASVAQTVSPTPGSIQDVSTEIPLPENFILEPQLQNGSQGSSISGNPLAFEHGSQFRPWLHYEAIPRITLTGSLSYIYAFTVPGTSYDKHPEWRVTAFATAKQKYAGSSTYEQLRFELLNFRATNGDVQHLPRVRARFGQNLFLSESRWKPYLGVYEEAILQFPQPSYSGVHFEGARFFAGYGFEYGEKARFLVGFKAEAEVSTNGSSVTLFYGPVLSVSYNFTSRPVNEKHRRTTAFKDF